MQYLLFRYRLLPEQYRFFLHPHHLMFHYYTDEVATTGWIGRQILTVESADKRGDARQLLEMFAFTHELLAKTAEIVRTFLIQDLQGNDIKQYLD